MLKILFTCVAIVTFADGTLSYPVKCAKALYAPRCAENVVTPVIAVKETVACIPKCCQELILPPKSVELPCGLGYSYTSIPTVLDSYFDELFPVDNYCYKERVLCETHIPISSECSCVKLATPVSPEWACLVKPIVL